MLRHHTASTTASSTGTLVPFQALMRAAIMASGYSYTRPVDGLMWVKRLNAFSRSWMVLRRMPCSALWKLSTKLRHCTRRLTPPAASTATARSSAALSCSNMDMA